MEIEFNSVTHFSHIKFKYPCLVEQSVYDQDALHSISLLLTSIILIIHFIGFGIFIRRVSKVPKIAGMRNSSSYLVISDYGLVNLTVVLAVAKMDNVEFTRAIFGKINEELALTAGYLLFFGCWNLGVLLFSRRSIVIPPERRRFVKTFTRVIFVMSFLAIISVPILISLRDINPSSILTTFVLSFFGVYTITSIILYIYFYRKLGRELIITKSKLTAAKITILRYSIIILLAVTVLIFITATLFFVLDDPLTEAWMTLLMYNAVALLCLIAGVFTFWSAFIPNWLRDRFDISSGRFQRIRVLKERVDTST